MWKPAYRWKRYRNLTKRGILVFWVVLVGSIVFSVWFWMPRVLDGGYLGSFVGLVLTGWAIQFAALELLRLISLRETRRES